LKAKEGRSLYWS